MDTPNNSINNTPNNASLDMATAIKTTPKFTGATGENIIAWRRDMQLLLKIWAIPETAQVAIYISALQGEALSWASEYVGNTSNITLVGFLDSLQKRFSGEEEISTIFAEFTQRSAIKSAKEFTEALRKGSVLYNLGCMGTSGLLRAFIPRINDSLRAMLWSVISKGGEWPAFKAEAERMTWVAFPEEKAAFKEPVEHTFEPMDVIAKAKDSKFCEAHGECAHNTAECKIMIRLKSRGWTKTQNKPKEVKMTIEEPASLDRSFNYSFISSFSSKSVLKRKNPFTIKANIFKNRVNTLIDTGADATLINKNILPKGIKLEKTERRLIGVTNTPLKLVGEIKNLEIRIHNKLIKVSALVMDQEGAGNDCIIGADTIERFPELLLKCLKKKQAVEKDSKVSSIATLSDVIKKNKDMFKEAISRNSLCTKATHRIETGDALPIVRRNARVPIHLEKEIDDEVRKNLERGIITESKSAWCSRIVPVPKKDGTLRMCIDYRPLNAVTRKDSYPIPVIDEIFDMFADAEFFTTLDATSGYFQIAMEPTDREKTAFNWKGGLYEFTRMPFGLCNAPATFQRAMDQILQKERGHFAIPYLDDIIIFSKTAEEHKKHVEIVLGKLRAVGLTLNEKKCKFGQSEVKILGHIISKGTIKPDPEKVKAIKEMKKPKNLKELRSFLGVLNYCRDFIPKVADITEPLYSLLKNEKMNSKKEISWTETSLKAFSDSKAALKEATSKAIFDPKKETTVITDASDVAISALLVQKDSVSGVEKIVHTFSKAMDVHQKNYSVTDKELLAVIKALQNFRHYLIGKPFKLKTDHQAIVYMREAKNPCSRLLRWSLILQEFDFTVEHVKGENNIADYMSRAMPVREKKQPEEAEIGNKEEILRDWHLKLGHGSRENMKFNLIKSGHKWQGMHTDIDKLVDDCLICKKAGETIVNTKNRIVNTKEPNELWEVDLIGYLPNTRRGSRFILVAIDHYTKWVETKALRTKTSREVANALKEILIDRHGIPQRILSDNGLEFKNNEVQELANSHKFEWIFNSPGHHQGIGAVERVNKTLMDKIKKLSDFGNREWDRELKRATDAVNLSFNRSINTSPFILRFGKLPRIKEDNKVETELEKSTLLKQRDEHHQRYAQKNIIKGKISAPNSFYEGQEVLIWREQLGKKLANNWHAGFKIKERIGPDSYIVTNGKSTLRANKTQLKAARWRGRGNVAVISYC